MAIRQQFSGLECDSARAALLRAARAVRLAVATLCLGFSLYPTAPAMGQASEPATLPTIVVQATSATPESSGRLTSWSSAPLATTPLSIDEISAADLQERGVNSLSTAIRTLPSVGDNYNTFGYIEALKVRGFTLDELLSYQRDGATVTSHVPVALENKESIEILKGTSGMLQGSSAPGGLVNYVLKQPTEKTLNEVDATVSERGSVLLHGDFGGRVGEQQRFGYRINVAAEERKPEIESAWSKRALVSGFFDWRVSSDTLLQAEFEHQRVREISVPGYGLLDTTGSGIATVVPPPIDPWINLNSQPWTQPFESTETSASVRLKQRVTTNWDLFVFAGTQRTVANDRVAFPDGCSYFNSSLNAALGTYYLYNGLCGNYNVDLYQYISDDEVRNTNSTDTRVHGHLAGAKLDQELSFGVRTTRYSERYPYEQVYQFVGTTNVFVPVALPANAAPNTLNTPLDTDLQEVYAFDVAHFAQHGSAWFGARWTRIEESSSLTDGTEATQLQQHFVTPWIGLGWEPWAGGFAYASAGSGIQVSNAPNHPTVIIRATGVSLPLANPGQVLPAQRSHQEELGFKQRVDELWWFDAALFRIVAPFDDVEQLANGEALVVAGALQERHQGLEVTSTWQALATLQLRASATLMDAKTIQAIDPSWIGKPDINVAPLAASLQDIWCPSALPGLAWSNIGTYSGHKAALPDGSVYLSNYWQWDTAMRYSTTRAGTTWTVRAGIDNVTDQRYWREVPMANWGSIYLFPAAARSARLSLAVSW
ncbi:MAG TPA: TonB-dependent siderophore receptor [Burkholderiaceae bacterium]|nr:TonB-dependent siderophore receptor [Burkholderiaceae bacterium]